MTLNAIKMKNFKYFRELRLPLAPLTLLSGFNASGKSTSIQPLLLFTQALRRNGETRFLDLNGPLVRLGTAGEILSADASEKSLSFEFDDRDSNIQWLLRPTEAAGIHGLEVVQFTATNRGMGLTTSDNKVWGDQVSEVAQENIIKLIRNVVYLSATRLGTSEVFPIPDSAVVNADVGSSGEYAAWWYAKCADDEVLSERRNPKEKGLTVRRQLDAYLSDLFPGGQATVELMSKTQLAHLEFRTSEQSAWLRPVNIGYGLSYAFPVLIALLLAEQGQIVVIDSPEAHLHPSGQSQMGRLLARFAAAGVQIIVETHSDHVLNGARLGVKEGILRPKDVAVHFFAGRLPNEKGNGIVSPRIDRNGALDVWPRGFFDQIERDLARL